MTALIDMIDQALIEAKDQARRTIAEDLRERLRNELPFYLRRLKRGQKHKEPLRRVFAELFIGDRKLAAQFYVGAIVRNDLHHRLFQSIAEELRLRKCFAVHEMVDHLLEVASILREAYPDNLRPKLPTRSNLANMIAGYCRRRMRL